MSTYKAILNQSGAMITNKEQAVTAIKNGFVILLGDEIVATTMEDLESLDFEPTGWKGA